MSSTWLRFFPLALAATAIAAGCAEGTPGALEQVDLADSSCEEGCAALGLEHPLAIGASISLRPSSISPGTSSPPVALRSAAADVVAVDGPRIAGVGEGFAAVLLIAEGSGDVVDFLHVFTRAPDALALVALGEEGPDRELVGAVQLIVGDELRLAARPTREGSPLGGALPIDWSVEGPAVVLLSNGDEEERRLVARDPGEAVVTARSGALEVRLPLEVLP